MESCSQQLAECTLNKEDDEVMRTKIGNSVEYVFLPRHKMVMLHEFTVPGMYILYNHSFVVYIQLCLNNNF